MMLRIETRDAFNDKTRGHEPTNTNSGGHFDSSKLGTLLEVVSAHPSSILIDLVVTPSISFIFLCLTETTRLRALLEMLVLLGVFNIKPVCILFSAMSLPIEWCSLA